jgi:hypothetical protein
MIYIFVAKHLKWIVKYKNNIKMNLTIKKLPMNKKRSVEVVFITIKLLDFVHRPDFYKQKTQRFGNWICFHLQAWGGDTYSTEKPKACLSTGDARTKGGQPLETRGL